MYNDSDSFDYTAVVIQFTFKYGDTQILWRLKLTQDILFSHTGGPSQDQERCRAGVGGGLYRSIRVCWHIFLCLKHRREVWSAIFLLTQKSAGASRGRACYIHVLHSRHPLHLESLLYGERHLQSALPCGWNNSLRAAQSGQILCNIYQLYLTSCFLASLILVEKNQIEYSLT